MDPHMPISIPEHVSCNICDARQPRQRQTPFEAEQRTRKRGVVEVKEGVAGGRTGAEEAVASLASGQAMACSTVAASTTLFASGPMASRDDE